MKKWIAVFAFGFITMLALTACGASTKSGAENAPLAGEVLAIMPAPGNAISDTRRTTSSEVNPPQNAEEERMVVRTARLRLLVTDPQATADKIASLAKDLGGFVASAELRSEGENSTADYGRITLRVPADKYDEAIKRLRGMGKEIFYSSRSQDVGKEYVDLQARLHHLRSAADRLEQIMAQAKKTQDVLAVYQQLSQVQEQIEQLQARLKYLENSVALASIEVDMERESEVKITVGKWDLGNQVKKAVQFLLKTFKMLAIMFVWLVLYIVPLLLLFYLIIVLPLKWAIHRFKSRLQVPPHQSEQ